MDATGWEGDHPCVWTIEMNATVIYRQGLSSRKGNFEARNLTTKENLGACQSDEILTQDIEMGKVAVQGRSLDIDDVSVDFDGYPHGAVILGFADDDEVLDSQDPQGFIRKKGLRRGSQVQKVDVDRTFGTREGENGFSDLDMKRDDCAEVGPPCYASDIFLMVGVIGLLKVLGPKGLGEGVMKVGLKNVFKVCADVSKQSSFALRHCRRGGSRSDGG